uniref:Uncharacterized protein n=1 Tax=Physcomitrium patens TaxID=3218 RepID=A0A2K1JZB3_PHYPA|nr:hypothetical protein PHYPA_013992 [Physcomitrium patens]
MLISDLRESMKYAQHLNYLGSMSDNIFMHVSKSSKIRIHQTDTLSVNLHLSEELKHESVSRWRLFTFALFQVAWVHEQFPRQRRYAATLSQSEDSLELLQTTSGITDSEYVIF